MCRTDLVWNVFILSAQRIIRIEAMNCAIVMYDQGCRIRTRIHDFIKT